MISMEANWNYPTFTEEEKEIYESLRGLPELSLIPNLSLQFLVRKGFKTVEQVSSLFGKSFNDLHNTYLLQDVEKGVQLIKRAIQEQQIIVVYGDYDADGTMGCVVLVRALRQLGARVIHFTNDRFKEGYGINPKGLKRLYERYPQVGLILTVDNGISAFDGVAYAKAKGTTVVVTDHHEPAADGRLPEADAVINAKRIGSTYPFRELCGAGLAFKLALTIAWEMGAKLEDFYPLVAFAGLATVADVVPLVDENRILVKESLAEAKSERFPIFRFLREAANVKSLNEETYGFTYGPMINACGRMTGSVELVIEMFLADQPEHLYRLAQIKQRQEQKKGVQRPFEMILDEVTREKLNWQEQMAHYLVEMNTYRKQITVEQERIAVELAEKQKDEPVIVLRHEGFHEGIVGLIAGQLKERFYRPIFIIIDEEEEEEQPDGTVKKVRKMKGSGRSIDGFHLKEVLDACSDYLAGYGGHAAAAGLTIKDGCFDAFEQAIREEARKRITPEMLIPQIDIDFVLDESNVDFQLLEELNPLRPFGVGFEKPVIALPNFDVEGFRYMTEGKHLKLTGKKLDVVMFNYGPQYQEQSEPNQLEVLGYPDVNVWNGNVTIQFMAQHIRARQGQLF